MKQEFSPLRSARAARCSSSEKLGLTALNILDRLHNIDQSHQCLLGAAAVDVDMDYLL